VPATSAEGRARSVDLLVLGSANIDVVARTPHLPVPGETVIGDSYHEYPGGKGLNQAVAAARAGAQVQLRAHFGDDSAGRLLREVLRDEGIDDRYVVTVPDLPTGRAMIWVDQRAENSIVVIPGANHAHSPEAGLDDGEFESSLATTRVVLAQLEVPLDAVSNLMQMARHFGCVRILNPAPAAELSADLLGDCEIVIPNQGELAALGGRQRLHGLGVRVVIETRGSRGVHCSIADSDGRIYADWIQPAFAVRAVDTTGAGDVFCGYFAAGMARAIRQGAELSADRLSEATLRLVVREAAAAAAIAVIVEGAVPSIPKKAQVDQLLADSVSVR
jgi:ribokinase